MLRLLNIKKKNGVITANYDPEGTGLLGFISLDSKTGKVVEIKASKYDEDFPNHLYHGIWALQEMIEKNEFPRERLVMWH